MFVHLVSRSGYNAGTVIFEVEIDQRNVGGVHGDVAADTAHGDTDKGPFQRRGIVDAIADHADLLPLPLIGVDALQLILRQTVGMVFPNGQLTGDMAGGVGR